MSDAVAFKAGVHLKTVFPPLNWFNANISSTFQVIQKLHAHFTKLCLAVFCKFFGDFWGCLERDSFSQRISKIGEIRNIQDLM